MKEKLLEIKYDNTKYTSIGQCCISIFDYPINEDWNTLKEEEPSIKICVFGALFQFYEDDSSSFKESYGDKLYNVIKENHDHLATIIHKYYEKGGEGTFSLTFIDFVHTYPENPINNEAEYENGGTLYFEDGSVLKILDKTKSWGNDVCNQYFVPSNIYKEVMDDINTLETLFLN